MKTLQISPGRRAFVRTVALTAPAVLGAAAVVTGVHSAGNADPASATGGGYRPKYFSPDEWNALSALVDRLIPADSEGPGAIEAGVPEFIDRQMNTPYGHGHLWYMHQPFVPDAGPEFGYQQPHAPRELYRLALKDLEQYVAHNYGGATASLDAAQRDALLVQLEQGKLTLAGAPSGVFFGQLLQNTYEGYFCDPVHGGNRDMAAWRMVGFPGARADYMDWVRQYGAKYPLPPISRR
jgi:gluconate 2-dehydrogenase gamma chain